MLRKRVAILPVRAVYNGQTQNIGVNELTYSQIWFAGPRSIASILRPNLQAGAACVAVFVINEFWPPVSSTKTLSSSIDFSCGADGKRDCFGISSGALSHPESDDTKKLKGPALGE